jgi:transposase
MSEPTRLRFLEASGLVHPRAGAVTAPLFASGGFFLAEDKVQVKYEMLRAYAVEGWPAGTAAATHGYSRSGFYLVKTAFARTGMTGLLDAPPGRRGPLKVTEEIAAFVRAAPAGVSGAVLVEEVERHFGVLLHRRTVERIRRW